VVRAVALGAAVVLGVGVPVATIGALLFDEGSDAVFPLAALLVAAFVAGGWLAGREAPSSSVLVGALAALAGFGVAQAVSVALQVADDEDVRVARVAANLALAAAGGVVGALIAGRRARA
jgi:hypothetical protein